MFSVRIIYFSVAGPVNVLFLKDMKMAFEMQLRKLLTEISQSQCQLSDWDAINQVKRQGIETLEANFNFIITAPYSMFMWEKHIFKGGYGIYSAEVAKSSDMYWKRSSISLFSRKFHLG